MNSDFGRMAQMLSLLQNVGDVVNFDKSKAKMLEGGWMPQRGGRGAYGSQWRDPRFVQEEAVRRGLRPDALMPASPMVPQFSMTPLRPSMSPLSPRAGEAINRAARPKKTGEGLTKEDEALLKTLAEIFNGP